MLKTDQPTPHDLEIATNWIYEQLANTANHAAREAKLELIDPGGIKFIGLRFGIARRKYLQDLSFNGEIPPWQFDIKYDFRKGSFSQDEMRAAKEAHIRKAGSMRCDTHGYAAHIRLHVRIARAWTVLMKRLGYTRFVAQGGDWGGVVVDMMGVEAPRN